MGTADESSWGAGAVCLAEARNPADEAAAMLRAAVPREWRSTAAREFVERLEELAGACGRAAAQVATADRLVRAHQGELAAARAALGPFGLRGWAP